MACGGLDKQTDAAAEIGRNPVSKHQVQCEYGDEQTGAGRDCRTRLAKPIPQARAGTGNTHFPCSADHEQDWQPYPVDPYSAICDDHTYILTTISTVAFACVLPKPSCMYVCMVITCSRSWINRVRLPILLVVS